LSAADMWLREVRKLEETPGGGVEWWYKGVDKTLERWTG